MMLPRTITSTHTDTVRPARTKVLVRCDDRFLLTLLSEVSIWGVKYGLIWEIEPFFSQFSDSRCL